MNERYSELSEDVKELFMEVFNTKTFALNIGLKFIYDSKLKQVVKVQKLPEVYNFLLNKEVLVFINEDLYEKLDEESLRILFEQEIDKIGVNAESGKIITNKPDIVTFSPLITKYGAEKVMRANQVDVLSAEQEEDMTTNFIK
jgi:hypothetical protein